jgi:hypothetical protein
MRRESCLENKGEETKNEVNTQNKNCYCFLHDVCSNNSAERHEPTNTFHITLYLNTMMTVHTHMLSLVDVCG